jgi:hypothetical protein
MNFQNWKPKNDLIGVPGRGFIKAEDFNEEDFNNLVARAMNRGIDPHAFLMGCGLVADNKQVELFVEVPEVKKSKKSKSE